MGHLVHKVTLVLVEDVDTEAEAFDTASAIAAGWLINPQLPAESDRSFWYIENDQILTKSQEDRDAQVAAAPLVQKKQDRYHAIDLRTESLIAEGFTYNSKTFSLSLPSQAKMTGAYHLRASLTYPIKWPSKDDAEYESLADQAALEAFYLAAFNAIRGHLDSGVALKESVAQAADDAAVDAVVDSR